MEGKKARKMVEERWDSKKGREGREMVEERWDC